MPNIYQQECPPDNSSDPDSYSGVALSYGMPIPYQEPLHSPTLESPPTTPYPLTNPYPNLISLTESNEVLESSGLKFDSSGKQFPKFFVSFFLNNDFH